MHVIGRIRYTIAAARLMLLDEGARAASMYVLQRLFTRHRALFFEGPASLPDVPPCDTAAAVQTFPSCMAPLELPAVRHLCRLGDADAFVRQGACLYVAYVSHQAAALGWAFPVSRPLLRLGKADGRMLGGFFVHERYRRRGLYSMLLREMCRDCATEGQRAYAEVSRENRASQQGLYKVGFRCVGELTFTVLFGVITSVRLRNVSMNHMS